MGGGLCGDVWRTCVWLCGAARVGEEMFEDSGFPVRRKDCGMFAGVVIFEGHYNLSYMKYRHFCNLGDKFCSDDFRG